MAGYVIVTRYAGPTNTLGSRIIGTGPAITHDAGPTRATVAWDHATDGGSSQHVRAAEQVAGKLRAAGWNVRLSGDWYALPTGGGYVFPLEYGTRPLVAEPDPASPVARAFRDA